MLLYDFPGGSPARPHRHLVAPVIAALLAVASPAVAGDPLPIAYFTKDDTIGTLKISPDGEYLAATAGGPGNSSLLFMRLEDRQLTSGIKANGMDEIMDFEWISATRVIFHYGERYWGHAFATNTGEIFATDRDGKRKEHLYGYRAGDERTGTRISRRKSDNARGELLSPMKNDDEHILILERPYEVRANVMWLDADAHAQVSKLDVYNGKKTVVDRVPLAMSHVITDRKDELRFAVGLDAESSLSAIWRPSPAAEWTKFELPGFLAESVTPLRFTSDESGVLFTAVADGSSVNALYKIDLESRVVERLYGHPFADIDAPVTDLKGDAVVGLSVYTDRLEYHWLENDGPTARAYGLLQRAFPGQAIEITSVADDGRRAIVFVHSDVNPGDYYLLDLETANADYLQGAREWVDPALMRPKEPIIVTARDGLRLHGYLTRPREGSGPFSLVVMPHGGPHGVRDRRDFDWEVQLLANRGYAVLQVNYRGSSGYGIEFEEAGYGEWGARMQDDVTDATRWAISEGIAEAGRVCMYGASYGGYAALMGLVREPGLYRCAVGIAGVYDLALMFEAGDTRRWRAGRAYLDRVLGEDPELLRMRSPVHNAAAIEAPVLLVHGKEDWRADYEHALRMKEALEDAGKPVEWLALGREGHGIFEEGTREEAYGSILEFLGRELPVEN